MASLFAATLTRATWPARFKCALLFLCSFGLGCVDLTKPWDLAHPDGSAAGAPAGGSDASAVSTGMGGNGPGPDSSGGGAGGSGTGGIGAAGGAGGSLPIDAGLGLGGNTTPSSSAWDAMGAGGSTEIDAPLVADHPQATGGSDSDAGTGTGGSAGHTGAGGGSGTGVDAGSGGSGTGGSTGQTGGSGTGVDAGSGGAGGTGGVGGTSGVGGAAGQAGGGAGGAADARDAATDLDASPDACALCSLGAALVHRYNFSGTGTKVTDSVGTAHGTVMNAQLSGAGTLVLAGGTSDQYVDLPDHIFSTLTSATLELWVTWTGGNNNQRILDFGSSVQSGGKYQAVTTVIISPNSAPDATARLRTSYSADVSASSTFVDATSTLATGSPQQVVAVFDGQTHTLSMYLNGALQGQTTGLGALSLIDDSNNWLGKSQYSDDPGFAGTYHEFRIYNAPLTAAQVQAVYAAGQEASFNQ